jgi:hypothetical protein
MRSSVLVVVTAIILSSCSLLPARQVSVPLPIPVEPSWIKITTEELNCLTQEVYEKLLRRDLQHNGFEARLLAILKSTHD